LSKNEAFPQFEKAFVLHYTSLALGLSRYNRGSRAVRGGYAYAARYARVIPVIAPYLNIK
jgi:hypothetical protein